MGTTVAGRQKKSVTQSSAPVPVPAPAVERYAAHSLLPLPPPLLMLLLLLPAGVWRRCIRPTCTPRRLAGVQMWPGSPCSAPQQTKPAPPAVGVVVGRQACCLPLGAPLTAPAAAAEAVVVMVLSSSPLGRPL